MLQGDRNALSTLYRKYYQPLLNYGLRINPHEEVVKDTIQDFMFYIWVHRNDLTEVKYVRSYIYLSLRRRLLRKDKSKISRMERDQNYITEYRLFNKIVDEEKLMADKELEDEQKQQLRNALALLNKREKEAVFLKFYSGLSSAEIAKVMGVNKQSVYNFIYRAIQAIKLKIKYKK